MIEEKIEFEILPADFEGNLTPGSSRNWRKCSSGPRTKSRSCAPVVSMRKSKLYGSLISCWARISGSAEVRNCSKENLL
jgi:hypothetical protein